MNAVGIVFSNIRDQQVPEITKQRIMASVPFGGRYRLIDFVLSNMTNSGINKVGIVTKRNHQNLLDHIGTGKAWDMARKRGGIRVIQPDGDENEDIVRIDSRLDTLKGIMYYLNKVEEEFVVLSDSDFVCNISYADILKSHRDSNSDVTILYKKNLDDRKSTVKRTVFELAENNRVTKVSRTTQTKKGDALFLGTMIFQKEFLKSHIMIALNKGYSRILEYWADHTDTFVVKGYEFKEYFAYVDSLESYVKCNLDLLRLDVREDLFRNPYRPIYTSVNDSSPTKYGKEAEVENSIIADGCIINGTVRNSVIFRGVRIDKGATVSNSIVMQDSEIGNNAILNHIVTDKNVTIGENRMLCGHETHPFFIGRGSVI